MTIDQLNAGIQHYRQQLEQMEREELVEFAMIHMMQAIHEYGGKNRVDDAIAKHFLDNYASAYEVDFEDFITPDATSPLSPSPSAPPALPPK